MNIKIHGWSQGQGKTVAMERAVTEAIKKNPKIVISRVQKGGGVITERPVEAVEIGPTMLEDKTKVAEEPKNG